jgi:hypothetical protein
MLQKLSRLLSEPVMGFLALAALVFGVTPELFKVSRDTQIVLATAEWIVVALFALEYLVHLLLAENRRAYVLNPWRVLDLVIILAPLVSLIPGTPEAARSSPALRVLRLARALLAGTRASARLRHHEAAATRRMPTGLPVVRRLDPDERKPVPVEWQDLLGWTMNEPRGWIHASNLEAGRVDEIARATGFSQAFIDAALGESAFPRFEPGAKWSALALSLPNEAGARESHLLLIGPQAVLSLSRFRSELQTHATPLPGTTRTWPLRVVLGIVRLALARHEEIAGRTERELRVLEDIPADESPEDFFERTFQLRRRITATKADLWRLHGIFGAIAEGRRQLPNVGAPEREEIGRVAEEAQFLHETADGIRESLLSLLDLHLNVSGYGMNRFMRLLAIVTTLALIPTIIGGLLGMNLVTNPWPATLAQVAFATFITMLCLLYTFLAKGWLK